MVAVIEPSEGHALLELVLILENARREGHILSWLVGAASAGGFFASARTENAKLEAFGKTWIELTDNWARALSDGGRQWTN